MLIHNQPIADYHASDHIGSSDAKLAHKSLQLLRDKQTGIYREPQSTCLSIGSIVHMAILEPDRFHASVCLNGPINPKTNAPYGRETKAFAEWQAENPDKILIDPWMLTMIDRMPLEIRSMFRKGKAEVSVYSQLGNGLKIKCRPDYLVDNCIIDLKTIDDADRIRSAITRYKYWLSHAWYRMTMRAQTGEPHQYVLIFSEKNQPHRWRIVNLEIDYVMYADDEVKKIANKIVEAQASGDWSSDDDINLNVDLPVFLQETEDDYAL